MSSLIIVGAGGLGLEVLVYAQDMVRNGIRSLSPRGFLDDTHATGEVVNGCPVLGSTNSPIDPEALYVIAVGDPKGRADLAQKLIEAGAHFTTLIHPAAYVAESAEIGEGTIAAPFAFVGANARTGQHTLLNIHSSVGHQAIVGDYCTFSPYASIGGGVVLENGVFLGSKANVMPRCKVGRQAKIAAGAMVYNTVPEDTLAMGNPASFRSQT